MNQFLDTARKHIFNIAGKNLNKKYVVFESDDWGSERIPSIEKLNYLTSIGIDTKNNPFNYLDSLETEDDLYALFEVLLKFSDNWGNHPILTANSVVANPDFTRIKASGYKEYFYENILQTYRNKKGCENSHNVIMNGISAGIYRPQFHGREHLNVRQWLSELQSGNKVLIKAFNAGIYGIDLDSKSTKRANFTAAFDSNSENESSEHESIIKEGVYLFNSVFKYSSKSFIAPCYVWHPSLEVILKENGLEFIQGLPIQYAPGHGGYKKIYHYQGEKNRLRQMYFVRNCFFEPALNPEFNWVEDCLRRIKIIFYWRKPVIIGVHRINFMGSLNNQNRKKNLLDFSVLIKTIIKTWPDVEFTTTDKLGESYLNNI